MASFEHSYYSVIMNIANGFFKDPGEKYFKTSKDL